MGLTGSVISTNNSAPISLAPQKRGGTIMSRHPYSDSIQGIGRVQVDVESVAVDSGLPNRLMTAFEVAEFVGCHEETVRRAYLRGLLTSQRFGVRGRRFHPRDVLDWIKRGAPTRMT